MKAEKNKMVGVDYKLTVDGQIADQSRPGQPLEFIFGTGMLLPKFEEAIEGREPGEKVSFTLSPKDGYGELIAEAVVDLPKNLFMVDGKLAEDILFVGSQVPMSDSQGNRMTGIVKEVGDEHVKMDFNHPMAGKTLNFDVEVVSVRDVTPEAVEQGRRYIDERRIAIALKEAIGEKLYIEVEARGAGHCATAVIAGGHTSFVYLERDGEVTLDKRTASAAEEDGGEVPLTLHRVWEFATTAPLDELRFILETRRLNKAAAERSLAGEFGHCVGRTLRCDRERRVMGDSIFTRVLSYTSAACDARMAGAMIPVMSNSGSGNQGIAATLPVAVYAEETHASEERMIRALTLSHLTVIYIKQSLGRLSALCGCVAATGSSCGVTYLMGGGYAEAAAAVKNMIANLTGMICDGAKPSCAMKLTSGVSTALLSAMMAMDGHCVTPVEGIIEEDVDKCIRNLTAIGRDGMNETDSLVLRIMTNKC